MTAYLFKMGALKMELPEPTIEAFEKFYDEGFIKFYIKEDMKADIIKKLQVMIDNKEYTVVEEEKKE